MLAARLCYQWGIPDVEGWLDSVENRVLSFWEAFDTVEPIGESWRQTADLKALIAQLIAAHFEVENVPTSDECMPPRFEPAKRKKERIEKPLSMVDIASAFGFGAIVKNGNNDKRS